MILAVLRPRFGGKDPAAVIRVCNMPNKDTGNDWHTHYFYETEAATEALGRLPDTKAIPSYIASDIRGGQLDPCLKHTIEMNIGVTGPWASQKKIVPYELLPSQAKNQQELERLVTAATEDYVLVGKEIQLPFYMRGRRKIAAVVYKNSELYESEELRRQTVQLLQQIDEAITLQREGKVSEEEVKALIAKLREKPTVAAQVAQQQPQLEQRVSDAYLAERFVVPARLNNADEINLVLRIVGMHYEVVFDAPLGFGMFRFTQPGYSNDEAVAKATETIQKLDALITLLRGSRTKEQVQQELQESAQRVYESLRGPQPPPQQTL